MSETRIAKPGDADLTVDLDGVTIASAVLVDAEVWVRAVGGFGMWVDGDEVVEFPAGDEVAHVETLDLRAGFPDADPGLLVAFYDQLCEWRDRAVPLRFCAAPGRPALFMETPEVWLPWPMGRPPSTFNERSVDAA